MIRTALAAAALVATFAAATPAAACPTVHRVTLPAVSVIDAHCTGARVVTGHAVYARADHVTYALLGPYESPRGPSMLRYTLEAHTVSRSFRWRAHHRPGPGWDRFTRRTATRTFDVTEFPACAEGPGPK